MKIVWKDWGTNPKMAALEELFRDQKLPKDTQLGPFLTSQEAQSLGDGEIVAVTWFGKSGPWRVEIGRKNASDSAHVVFRTPWRSEHLRLDFVGSRKFDNHVQRILEKQ